MASNVVELTKTLVLPILEEKALELVDVEFKKEGRKWYLRVYIDKPGGVDIEDCSAVSESLSAKLDEVDPIDQAYFLEVSSPGAERPLKNEEDIRRAVGKFIYVTTYEPVEGQKAFEGRLIQFDGENLTIEIKVKHTTKTVDIPYAKVAKARLAVVF
ncbi:Ribosome maturation factor rimP [Caldalkalibacillus thermarum TA2.A1]|uniref:Ribosome maturation factor RimP n=1 Tax=Caldalkalibacillus thermarum (strain TA2.A1) TaxID=986075 RepID=F5L9U7_CALTT|nr:ribosome maturation factor RimP [Caldalkalibacillus thermarum]EGL81946.1 Ribosome maturation factor rimP [Caldalkalibacillus thermarum TA2.A1]QZT32986.1 ribosome maturation factor RimP [Caldalkalibacillus thermarum TA2.A1]